MSISYTKFFLYARKSTDVEDKQILSIEAQLAELREYATREKLCIIDELIEKQSAKNPGRPIFNSMLARVEKGQAEGIVCWHPDRLARNSVDGGKIIYLIDRGYLKHLKCPSFWFEPTPQGKFMLSIAFGQSKYFVDSLSENTKRGLRQKVRRGEYPSWAPVGYINDVRAKTIVIDKNRAPIVVKAFELFATGAHTITVIANFLAKRGVLTRNGRPHKVDWVHNQFLANPFYYGYFRYTGELFEGIHEPLITKQLFDQVQTVLAQKGKPRVDPPVPKPFLGLLTCGGCGMSITAERKIKFYKGTHRQVTYIYYRCTKKSKVIRCKERFIRQEELDKQLSELIETFALPADWADKILKRLDQEKKDTAQSAAAFVQSQRETVTAITSKLQFLVDAYLEQVIDRESYLQKKAELLSHKKSVEEKINSFEQTQTEWLAPMRAWVKDAASAANIARGDDLDAKKVLLLKIFGSDLTLTDKKARGSAPDPWAALRAAPTTRSWERVKGIEPSRPVWKTGILPLNYTRTLNLG